MCENWIDDESDNSVMMMMMLMVMAVVVKSHKKQNYCDRFLAFCVKIIIIIFFTKKKYCFEGFFSIDRINWIFSLKNSHFYSRSFGNFISFFGGKKIKKNWMKKALFQKNYFSFWWNIFSFQSIFSLSNCHQKYFSSSSSS